MLDYANTARARQQRTIKATTLAAWCYAQGLGPDATTAPAPILRAIARAAGVPAPHHRQGRSPTWELVADLLQARREWDRRHHVQSPSPAHCVHCALHGTHPPAAAAR